MTPDVRVSERVEWANVYKTRLRSGDTTEARVRFPSREEADKRLYFRVWGERFPRIAVERITITERVERICITEDK